MHNILDTGKQEAEKLALEQVKKNHAEVDVTASGLEASVNTTRFGAKFTAYFKQLWNGKTEAGAKVEKDF